MSVSENNEKILKNAACLTFSDLLLSGDADVRLINKKPQVYIYKNTTISGIMESLYILDNLGVNTEELTLESSIFNFEEGVDFTEPSLQVCIEIYNEDYKIDRSKIYDYDEKELDYFSSYSYYYPDEPKKEKKEVGMITKESNTPIGEIDEKQAEELLTIYFDKTKFKNLSSDQAKMCLVDYIKDDIESGQMMEYVSDKVEGMIIEYDKLMKENVKELDQYTDVHLKRMALIEETRVNMKIHKVNMINKELELKAKSLCADVKESEQEYIKTIIASVVSLKNLADKAVTNLLEEVFNSFSKTLREQYDAVIRIMDLGDGY